VCEGGREGVSEKLVGELVGGEVGGKGLGIPGEVVVGVGV
jgi:hypothetical protein